MGMVYRNDYTRDTGDAVSVWCQLFNLRCFLQMIHRMLEFLADVKLPTP